MKKIFAFLFIFSLVAQVSANETKFKKLPTEDDKTFVARVTKYQIHNNQIGASTKVVAGTNTIVAFTETPYDPDQPNDPSAGKDLTLNLFIPQTGGDYLWVSNIACEVEGGSGEMKAFFYANLETTTASNNAVGVICQWGSSSAAECDMNDQVKFFQYDPAKKAVLEVKNDKFKAFYGTQKSSVTKDFDCTTAKFKNVADVKRMLKEMGFEQKK